MMPEPGRYYFHSSCRCGLTACIHCSRCWIGPLTTMFYSNGESLCGECYRQKVAGERGKEEKRG